MHELRAIEADFRALARHLESLIELYVGDPSLCRHVGELRAAHEKAVSGAELVLQHLEQRS